MLFILNISKKKRKGFTLIELLIVITIISILFGIVLLIVNSARNKARYAKTEYEQKSFATTVAIAQGESNKTLLEITGNNCSSCVCSGDLRNIPNTSSCYLNWIHALNAVQDATNGMITGLNKMKQDPWGSPYLLDENEGENGDCSKYDIIRTVGPDGIKKTTDDLEYNIPLSGTCH